MTSLDALNWLAKLRFILNGTDADHYVLHVWMPTGKNSAKEFMVTLEGPFGEVLPQLVQGIINLHQEYMKG